MNPYSIEIEGLCHHYRSHKKGAGLLNSLKDMLQRQHVRIDALKNICLKVQQGEIVGLLGPNGAGKTTLLKILAGLMHPACGQVAVLGCTPYHRDSAFLKQIGMVMGQKSQLLWDIPALDTLCILKELYDIPLPEFKQRLADLSDLLAITHLMQNPVRKLSLGERMKFELVASLIHNPKLLFLDEPTIGLDIVSQRAIRSFLQEINRNYGTTIIITSHYMRDIEILAKRVVVLKDGAVFCDRPIHELLQHGAKAQKVYFSTPLAELSLPLACTQLQSGEYVTTCTQQELQQVIASIASHIPLQSIRTEESSLEEALFSILAAGQAP